jgi:hypothetical protein
MGDLPARQATDARLNANQFHSSEQQRRPSAPNSQALRPGMSIQNRGKTPSRHGLTPRGAAGAASPQGAAASAGPPNYATRATIYRLPAVGNGVSITGDGWRAGMQPQEPR